MKKNCPRVLQQIIHRSAAPGRHLHLPVPRIWHLHQPRRHNQKNIIVCGSVLTWWEVQTSHPWLLNLTNSSEIHRILIWNSTCYHWTRVSYVESTCPSWAHTLLAWTRGHRRAACWLPQRHGLEPLKDKRPAEGPETGESNKFVWTGLATILLNRWDEKPHVLKVFIVWFFFFFALISAIHREANLARTDQVFWYGFFLFFSLFFLEADLFLNAAWHHFSMRFSHSSASLGGGVLRSLPASAFRMKQFSFACGVRITLLCRWGALF
jgi:hypothetical protein